MIEADKRRTTSLRKTFQRRSGEQDIAVAYVKQNIGPQIDSIRRWVHSPNLGLAVTLADINLLRFAILGNPLKGSPDLSSFVGDKGNIKRAREYLQVRAWQQEIAGINARLDRGTYILGGSGGRKKQELPLTESKRSRMIAKRTRLGELLKDRPFTLISQ